MKKVTVMTIVALLALCVINIAIAASPQEVTLDKGKALFNDPRLGTSGKSCNTCHPDGKGLDKAGEKSNLESILNSCITKGLKGKALDVKSAEMQSLVMYVKSFGTKKPAATKKPQVGC